MSGGVPPLTPLHFYVPAYYGPIQAQQYCLILLTIRNNVPSTILLHPVFNNLLQLIFFGVK